MNKVLLGLTSMCMFPLAAHATLQSITFDLLNDYASVINPIAVTDGYVTLQGDPSQAGCNISTTQIPLAQIAQLPLSVQTNTETSISVPVTSDMISCLQNPDSELRVTLQINAVDGKTKKGDYSQCSLSMYIQPQNVDPLTTLKIQETQDTFNCTAVMLKK